MTIEQKTADLEKIVMKQTKIIAGLLKRIALLERENARRKQEIHQMETKHAAPQRG